MITVVRWYSLIAAIALIAGETLVLVKTGKYLPLSIDDYLVAAWIAACAWRLTPDRPDPSWLLAGWAFATGNLYAILFSRMDPTFGSGQRIGLVTIALLAAAVGLLATAALGRQVTPPDNTTRSLS